MTAPRLAWYGDDFTGSTDALEVLASGGLQAVLFFSPPTREDLARFGHPQAVGLAGISRSQSPEWMDAHLPALFEALRATGAAVCHYKVCSTFDSSPRVGSIGRAIEVGARVFGQSEVPVVVGVPALGRYTIDGRLYAMSMGGLYRIDRHPVMSRHPVTPMDEPDLMKHLARQSDQRLARLIDVWDEATLRAAGRALWSEAKPLFVAGSSGVEYALMAEWGARAVEGAAGEAERMIVLSGSCSEVTARQIRWALANGAAGVKLDVDNVDAPSIGDARMTVLYSSLGTEDSGEWTQARREQLARQCGRLLKRATEQSGVRRVVVAGGDTSSHAGRELGLEALTYVCGLEPGAPLCRAHARGSAMDGLEIVFKGGQVGREDFFELARRGGRRADR